MNRRTFAFVATFALVAGACGGGDSGSCAVIADDAVALVQDLIDEIDDMSLDQLAAIDETFTVDFESSFEELQTRADDADCSDNEMADLVEERVGDLTAESEFGQLFIQGFLEEGFGG